MDSTLSRRYDLQPFQDFPDSQPIDLCAGYAAVCGAWLDHIQCPARARSVAACVGARPFGYDAFEGRCNCFDNGPLGLTSSDKVAESLVDVLSYSGDVWPELRRAAPEGGGAGAAFALDLCASYLAVCARVLTAIGCPAELRSVAACGPGGANGTAPASPADFAGSCACGSFRTLSYRVGEFLVDSVVAREVARLAYFPPPTGAFALIAGTDPFRQLRQPRYNPPPA